MTVLKPTEELAALFKQEVLGLAFNRFGGISPQSPSSKRVCGEVRCSTKLPRDLVWKRISEWNNLQWVGLNGGDSLSFQ